MQFLPLGGKFPQQSQHVRFRNYIRWVEQVDRCRGTLLFSFNPGAQRWHTFQPPFFIRYPLEDAVSIDNKRFFPSLIRLFPLCPRLRCFLCDFVDIARPLRDLGVTSFTVNQSSSLCDWDQEKSHSSFAGEL